MIALHFLTWPLVIALNYKVPCLPVTGFIEDESPYGEKGKRGTYFFEFSRPLRTMDRFQQVKTNNTALKKLYFLRALL